MCGIAGFISQNTESRLPVIKKMCSVLSHRGPDNQTVWVDESAGVSLAHSRLSVQDLSANGDQPMVSSSGRYVIVFNGEIYNHLSLRTELYNSADFACTWRGSSDTETILHCVEYWGISKTLQKLAGMFAFALWDKDDRVLTLSIDRVGEKPLYYGFQQGSFLFGSELKALRQHPDWLNEINRSSLSLFVKYSYVPAPNSIFLGINKVLPGTFIQYKVDDLFDQYATPRINTYWSLADVIRTNTATHFIGSDQDAIGQLDSLLTTIISEQMLSDVELGAFLSGGYDSSAVVALMQKVSNKPIETFSMGFNESFYNEAKFAKAIASHLGTNHNEWYVSSNDAINLIPKLPTIYDEPFSDSSQIPTCLVSIFAKSKVTVALSGDGGDEVFGGYNRHVTGPKLWEIMRRVPYPLRLMMSAGIQQFSPHSLDSLGSVMGGLVPQIKDRAGEKLHKIANTIISSSQEEMYSALISHWRDNSLVIKTGKHEDSLILGEEKIKLGSFSEQMMYLDTINYLPGDILTKVDRAAMAVSLETRMPFVDHRLIDFAWSLPLSMKIRNGQGKWILRQMLYQYVPNKLLDRPKMGFGVPIGSWLRGPLRDWAESLLSVSRLKHDNYFEPSIVRKKWDDHLSGKSNCQHHLWDILMFNAWLDLNK